MGHHGGIGHVARGRNRREAVRDAGRRPLRAYADPRAGSTRQATFLPLGPVFSRDWFP